MRLQIWLVLIAARRALAGSVQCLVLAKMSELDRQSLTETYGEFKMLVKFLFVKK